MIIKGITEEDFTNYKKPSMFIAFPSCTFKCEKECCRQICQNAELALSPSIDVSPNRIVSRYLDNPITKAIVLGGLEPFDSWDDLVKLLWAFRGEVLDDIVIYTGYNKDEIECAIKMLTIFPNVIVKFGRYVPDQDPHYDEVLGVNLASDNQYAEKIS